MTEESPVSPGLDPLLTVADVAAHIGANEATVRHWIHTGQLRASKLGSRIGWRIARSDYEAFLARRRLVRTLSGQLLAAGVMPDLSADPAISR
jgi:excisionase family DNA binding protein